MKQRILVSLLLSVVICGQSEITAQKNKAKAKTTVQSSVTVPVIVNGEAQKIAAFENPDDWIREDLWVETEFDTDGDGRPDRMHVDVTRPKQTETEGLKLPVVYESSPYFAGTAGDNREYFYDVRHELNTVPSKHVHPPQDRKSVV